MAIAPSERTLHVVLAAFHAYPSPQAIPLANAFLASSLLTDEELAEKIRVTLSDFYCSVSPKEAAQDIVSKRPFAVGFSAYLWNRTCCQTTAEEIRRLAPEIILFAGGPEVAGGPGGLESVAPYDFLVLGEGERPFIEAMGRLVKGESLENIKGIRPSTNSSSPVTTRHPVEILDAIPSPYLTGILDPRQYAGVLWQLSRGCDFSCDFCFDTHGGKGVRRFSLERVEQELRLFVDKRVSQVFVLDSTFNVDIKRAKQILRLIRKLAPHIHFHFEARSEFIDAELAELFGNITCSVQIGLQSADPEVLKLVHRHLDPKSFQKKISFLNKAGVVFGFDIIYGLPGDTFQGFQETIDFAVALLPNHLDIFPLAVLPGTRLAEKAPGMQLDHLSRPPYTVIGSPTFPQEHLQRGKRLAAACDIFYSRGKAVAWFPSVLAACKVLPHELLIRFSDWMDIQKLSLQEEKLKDDDIWQMQRNFVQDYFAERKISSLLAAALDLIDYNHHYAAALLAPEPELPTDRELAAKDLLTHSFCVPLSTRLAKFTYEIYDILESEPLDLKEFCTCFRPTDSFAAIYPRAGEVFTESLMEPYFELLQRMDGKKKAGDIAATLRIASDEAASFLEFACAEGIIVFASPAGS